MPVQASCGVPRPLFFGFLQGLQGCPHPIQFGAAVSDCGEALQLQLSASQFLHTDLHLLQAQKEDENVCTLLPLKRLRELLTLIAFLSDLLSRTLAGQSLFQSEFVAWFQIVGVPFCFLENIFRLDFALKAP